MRCPACESTEGRVISTRDTGPKVARLRSCSACGHRWNTVELSAQNLARMESAVQAVRTFSTLSKELEDAETAHG